MSRVIEILMAGTGLREADLRQLIHRAPRMYKYYSIDKRSGGKRLIAQPARQIKFLQRVFMNDMLSELPIHYAATAYRKGYSIVSNAIPHAKNNGPILKLDFKEFFPSIRGGDWRAYCRDNHVFNNVEDIFLSELLLFNRSRGQSSLRLAIGAPSSPMLSNILLYKFDEMVSNAVLMDKVTYTRYADDMTFSARRTGFLVNVKRDVARVIRSIPYPSLDINDEKTTYITKKYHRTVTGVTITNQGGVSIGRDAKREISAAVHHALNGKLNPEDFSKIAGRIAYANSIDPTFLVWLKRKYGEEVVKFVQEYGWISGHEKEAT